MPQPIYTNPPDADWVRNSDFFYTGTIANATAAQTLVPSASGYYNCISKLVLDNQSGAKMLLQLQDNGTPTVMMEDFTLQCNAASAYVGPLVLDFQRGLELKQPVASKNIDVVASVSGTFTYFISGFRFK